MLEVNDRSTDPAAEEAFFDRLEGMEPGSELALMLDRVDRSRLNGYRLVTVTQAWARQRDYVDAELYASMAELVHCPPGDEGSPPVRMDWNCVDEFASDLVSTALRLTRWGASDQLSLALDLTQRLPDVLEALREGGKDRPVSGTADHQHHLSSLR